MGYILSVHRKISTPNPVRLANGMVLNKPQFIT